MNSLLDKALGLLLALAAIVLPSTAYAHGFGQRFDLPIPIDLYMTGAGAVVALSFVIMAFFFKAKPAPSSYPRFNLLSTALGRALASPAVLFTLRVLSVTLFVVTIAAGLFGTQADSIQNIIHTAVWVIWWVGLAYVSALFGDLFALISPWKIIYSWVGALYCRVTGSDTIGLDRTYPERWQNWPAVILFMVFAWAELVWGNSGGSVPANLAMAVLIYSAVTWVGMFVFGQEIWLQKGEAFAVVFRLLARFAPFETRTNDKGELEWNVRPYAVGLLTRTPPTTSMMVFTILVLSIVTFDGFLETTLWGDMATWIYGQVQWMGPAAVDTVNIIGLVGFPLVFLGVYLVFCKLVALTQPNKISVIEVGCLFVFALVPISFAYHLAHYIMFFLIGSQFMIPLISDPFGWGWDIFGTIDYPINIGIVGAWFLWYTAVAAIIVGHVVAVYLAHVTALDRFGDNRLALRSQYPLLILMIAYTMISLWILAQPISEN